MKETKEWFATWFDTDEYHALYGHRDAKEAEDFVVKLIDEFNLDPCKILDAGCGAGRHVHSWAKFGFDATGFDLSPNSIDLASKKADEVKIPSAKFHILDLRHLHKEAQWESGFDVVTNLFTSFGYFPKQKDHIDVVKGFSFVLRKGGFLVLDYINPPYSEKRLVSSEVQSKQGINFNINREIKDGFFTKTIKYCLPGEKTQTYTELVKVWTAYELAKLLSSVGLKLKSIFGDYDLNEYHEDSPRMILIAEKK